MSHQQKAPDCSGLFAGALFQSETAISCQYTFRRHRGGHMFVQNNRAIRIADDLDKGGSFKVLNRNHLPCLICPGIGACSRGRAGRAGTNTGSRPCNGVIVGRRAGHIPFHTISPTAGRGLANYLMATIASLNLAPYADGRTRTPVPELPGGAGGLRRFNPPAITDPVHHWLPIGAKAGQRVAKVGGVRLHAELWQTGQLFSKIPCFGVPADVVLTRSAVPLEAGVADTRCWTTSVGGVRVVAGRWYRWRGSFTAARRANGGIVSIAAAKAGPAAFLHAGDVGNNGRRPVAV